MNIDMESNESILTDQDWEAMVAAFTWDVEQPCCADLLYHYYSSRSVKRVIKKDGIYLRLAAAATFPDKMEGKAVEVFYDLALDELRSEKRITARQYEDFSKISVPEKLFLAKGKENGMIVWGDAEYEEYIICFSTEENDPYMFDNYIKDADGYCLHFFGLSMRNLTLKSMEYQAEIKLIPVLYGRKVVDFIRNIIEKIAVDPIRSKNYEYFITDLLHYVQYAAKLSKYSKENEVRLVVFIPKELNTGELNGRLNKSADGEYLFFKIGKELLFDVTPAPYNTKTETKEIKTYLEDNGYSNMLETS